MQQGNSHSSWNLAYEEDSQEHLSSLESLSCEKLQISTNDPHNVNLKNGVWDSLQENSHLQLCDNSRNQYGLQNYPAESPNFPIDDDPSFPRDFPPLQSENQSLDLFEIDEHTSSIEICPSESTPAKYQKLIFEPKQILNQNNNYPKFLLNRFFDYLETQELQDDQRVELSHIFQELYECQFKKAGLKHFRRLFYSSNSQHSNRRHLHAFLTDSTFRETILKSNAIREVVKKGVNNEGQTHKPTNNKLRYLLGAKLGISRSRSKNLVIRIQTTRNSLK